MILFTLDDARHVNVTCSKGPSFGESIQMNPAGSQNNVPWKVRYTSCASGFLCRAVFFTTFLLQASWCLVGGRRRNNYHNETQDAKKYFRREQVVGDLRH